MPYKTVEEALAEHSTRLMSLAGVVGVGRGKCDEKPCIMVLVAGRTDQLLEQIPTILDGYVASVQETGEFRALRSD